MLSDPISTGSPAAVTATSRVYPGVFALATLLEVVSISCWLTESPLSATERDPNNPDIVVPRSFSQVQFSIAVIRRLQAGLLFSAGWDRACKPARNCQPRDAVSPGCARGAAATIYARAPDDGCGLQSLPTPLAAARNARFSFPGNCRALQPAAREDADQLHGEVHFRGGSIAGRARPDAPLPGRSLPRHFPPAPGCSTPCSPPDCARAEAAARPVLVQ